MLEANKDLYEIDILLFFFWRHVYNIFSSIIESSLLDIKDFKLRWRQWLR